MKKSIVVLVAVLMVATAGCEKKEGAEKTAAPIQTAEQSIAQQVSPPLPSVPTQQEPQFASPQESATPPNLNTIPGGDPHAGLKLKTAPATGAGHTGKVLQVLDVSGYTYLEVEEKGRKLWVAAIKTKVNKGDLVEFPDSQPMENFQSKTLKRTFEKIYFADALRVLK